MASSDNQMIDMSTDMINAGRILVVGSQGGGKSAIATRLSAMTDPEMKYKEEFGGTIETEYLKVSYENQHFFALLLPIGGQEKWASLRKQFGSTAEAIIMVLDSVTKEFWNTSLGQAVNVSTAIPYEGYPVAVVINKRDLNEMIGVETKLFSSTIIKGIKRAQEEGLRFYSRGHRVIERQIKVEKDKIPFSKTEQCIVNALEGEYFRDLEPGNALKGTQLLKGFSLVNCRLFARALTSSICEGKSKDQSAVLSLLNDMRPTLLELDTTWEDLRKKYPAAGPEPYISGSISESDIEEAILDRLLASHHDIKAFNKQVTTLGEETGWSLAGSVHASTFEKKGLQSMSNLVKQVMDSIANSKATDKFTLFDPLEDVF